MTRRGPADLPSGPGKLDMKPAGRLPRAAACRSSAGRPWSPPWRRARFGPWRACSPRRAGSPRRPGNRSACTSRSARPRPASCGTCPLTHRARDRRPALRVGEHCPDAHASPVQKLGARRRSETFEQACALGPLASSARRP